MIHDESITWSPPRAERNRPGELAYIQQQAEQLITYASRLGIVVTIEQQPRQPLAVGSYDSVASVRFARSTNTE